MMKPGFAAKLFLALLVTNVAIALAVGFGVRIAFDRGFERYVEEREEARRARLAEVFGEAYREHGSWDFLRGNASLWTELNQLVRPQRREMGFPAPGKPPGAPHDMPPKGIGFGAPPGPPGPPPGVLLDLQRKVVAGDARADQALRERPVMVDGKRVGTLAHPVRLGGFDLVDRRLQAAMAEASSWVAAFAILLSAIAAWLLSRGLLSPVRRLAAATRQLADGRYDTRVRATTGDELGRLADDFNRLGNTLEKNEAVRRAFMADVSHELRTPLAVLKGELEAIQDGVRPADAEAIASLQAEVARLGKLVDDIHDLSLADVGGLAFRFEPVDLAALARSALDGAAGRLATVGLLSAIDTPARRVLVRGDAQRLSQLLANLLENSLRYTDAGGTIRVAIGRDEAHGVLTWEDTKPGVPAEALPRLFERLYRVDASRNRAAGGSGLGLAIARSIVEAHGGRIVATPSELGGLRITVTLPLAEAP